MGEGRWLDEREQRAWRAFVALYTQLPTVLGRRMQRDSGLSGSDYQILVTLSESPQGRLRAFEIAEATMWEKSRLSHHLSRMAQRGLIERQTCSEDTRYADIVLTPAGRSAIEAAAPRHVSDVRSCFIDPLTPDQLDAFTDACQAVLARLDEERHEDAARHQ